MTAKPTEEMLTTTVKVLAYLKSVEFKALRIHVRREIDTQVKLREPSYRTYQGSLIDAEYVELETPHGDHLVITEYEYHDGITEETIPFRMIFDTDAYIVDEVERIVNAAERQREINAANEAVRAEAAATRDKREYERLKRKGKKEGWA